MASARRVVTLNVYDVAPPQQNQQQPQPSPTQAPPSQTPLPTDAAPAIPLISRVNQLGRASGLGGVFHGGVAVDGKEYAFGFCERGTGVYATRPKQNPLYTWRETVVLGETTLPPDQVLALISRLKSEWPGCSYDLLRRNCCHFCAEMARELGVSQPPAWLNRLANAGEVTAAAAAQGAAMARAAAEEAGRLGMQAAAALRGILGGAGGSGGGGGSGAGQAAGAPPQSVLDMWAQRWGAQPKPGGGGGRGGADGL
jgi:deubiquitinase DESI2